MSESRFWDAPGNTGLGYDCPSDECPCCTGEACDLCGAGCWDSSAKDCTHDVVDRHIYGGSPEGKKLLAIETKGTP